MTVYLEQAVPADPIQATPGFFKTRLIAGGPWVPARLWYEAERDELGAICDDVRFFAEIDGQPTDPFSPRGWPWRRISVVDFQFMTAAAAWDREYDPQSPAANPERPVTQSEVRIV